MSTEIYERNGLFVTRYCGPAPEISGIPDRARWQITVPSQAVTALLRAEVIDFANALLASTEVPYGD